MQDGDNVLILEEDLFLDYYQKINNTSLDA